MERFKTDKLKSYIPTTQAVLRSFKDDFLLEELIKGATRDVDADAQVMNSKSSLREKEIEALFPSKASKSFAPPSASDMADRATLESFLDHADYQPQSYISDCKFFGLDPEHPRFPSNSPTFQFKSWQVTGMRRMIRILDNPTVQACVLADTAGLTQIQRGLAVARHEQLLEDYNEKKELHERWNAARDALLTQAQVEGVADNGPDQNPFAIPDLSIRPLSPKPILLIVLSELIEQWATEIKKLSEDFKALIYHGEERTSNFGSHEKVSAKSTKEI
ncbi:hypothetical protein BOTNAR_0002g00600 [Botryotinia narcissicola]|uniref:SNF2 N-terminal domain-containing protein n=1 Tax=Botryotinia narcissicola TaxID=278944 RepID=A0A4Z1J9H7_9HELO|nr:hypothetical protein BOTNAR_0002g00600 [Botryotinia narcissicola]